MVLSDGESDALLAGGASHDQADVCRACGNPHRHRGVDLHDTRGARRLASEENSSIQAADEHTDRTDGAWIGRGSHLSSNAWGARDSLSGCEQNYDASGCRRMVRRVQRSILIENAGV